MSTSHLDHTDPNVTARMAATYRGSMAVIRDRLDGLSERNREWLLRKTAERVFFT